MPIYEYLCTSCEYQFEEVQKFSDPSLDECPDCGKNSAERQVSISSFHLKGGGWFKDGYSNNAAEKQEQEKSGKEGVSKSSKEPTTVENSPVAERPSITEKKESNSNKIAKTSSKEKAA